MAQRPRADAGYDVVIANGRVVDGSGNPWFYADLAIENGHIAKIGKIDPKLGKRVIDAKGMVVTPGFIDLHTHSDMTVLADGNAESKVRHGVTLDVIGESATVAPLNGGVLEEYKEEAKRRNGVDVDWTTLEPAQEQTSRSPSKRRRTGCNFMRELRRKSMKKGGEHDLAVEGFPFASDTGCGRCDARLWTSGGDGCASQ